MSLKSVDEQKNELRKKYKELRKSYSEHEKSELDRKITERFFELDFYKNVDTVFAFVSKDIEVSTRAIILNAFAGNKKVAVPLCDTSKTEMSFYYINSFDDLNEKHFGILEPDAEKCVPAEVNDAQLIIVPGLVFDKKGYRIGFGKGYYDRFIPNFNGIKAGICYSNCIEDKLPFDTYDRSVDLVITDKYIIDTR